jgi:hypothetical protein
MQFPIVSAIIILCLVELGRKKTQQPPMPDRYATVEIGEAQKCLHLLDGGWLGKIHSGQQGTDTPGSEAMPQESATGQLNRHLS